MRLNAPLTGPVPLRAALGTASGNGGGAVMTVRSSWAGSAPGTRSRVWPRPPLSRPARPAVNDLSGPRSVTERDGSILPATAAFEAVVRSA